MSDYWSGDERFYLPARRVEPYRLWFEYLKAAISDPNVEIDTDFYADWGNVEGEAFSDWWSGDRWRSLFAIDNEIRILQAGDVVPDDKQSMVIRVPIGQDATATIRDLRDLLEERSVGVQFKTVPQGRFALTEGYENRFLKKLDIIRAMLRLYQAWLRHADKDDGKRLIAAAEDVYDWADKWNRKVGIFRNSPRNIRLPDSLLFWVAHHVRGEPIVLSQELKRAEAEKDFEKRESDGNRRQVQRYLQKARKIAANVGRGEFPGKY